MVPLSETANYYENQVWIHPSQVITCDGAVISSKFYATGAPGVIMAGIWQQTSSNTFTLIGKTRIKVSTQGAHVRLVHIS